MKADKHMDINADVGEGIGNEVDLMPYLSSCNMACGVHARECSARKERMARAVSVGFSMGTKWLVFWKHEIWA